MSPAFGAMPYTALIVPLLTVAAAWGIAIWALRKDRQKSGAVRALTEARELRQFCSTCRLGTFPSDCRRCRNRAASWNTK